MRESFLRTITLVTIIFILLNTLVVTVFNGSIMYAKYAKYTHAALKTAGAAKP